MKLWLKISLVAIILVTAATSVCSLLMLLSSGRNSLELAITNTLTDQQLRASSWLNAMNKEISTDSEYGVTAQRTLSRYMIGQFTDVSTSVVLISGDDDIYNSSTINPRDYLRIEVLEQPQENLQQYIIKDVDGRTMLFTGSNMQVQNTPYTLYILRDISNVFSSVEVLSNQFTIINLAVIFVAGIGIILLVRLLLKPVAILKQNSGLIASGIYNKRIIIKERDEIGDLAEDFNRMAAAVESHVHELEEEAQRRTMFMSALTHELKTPMTSISGNAQTLLRTKMTEEEREDALIRIDDECTRIERLSQKLMQLIVLRQNGVLELAQVRVSDLLETVRSSSAEQIKQRGLTLTIENNMDTIPIEKDLFSSLLLNLIDNAGKASKQGDIIRVTASGNTISIADCGKGVPPNELSKITQPFYMVDKSRSKAAGGIGLGLALCEEIARLHNATIIFDSELGRGTTVKVVFGNE